MRITNISDRSRAIAATTDIVGPGESVEVTDELGKSLCEQTDRWAEARTKTQPEAKSSK